MFWSMLLDLSAMLFCSVIILLPIFAHDILHLGVEGLGILRAAPAIGACIMMLMLTCYSPMQNAWRNMLYSSFAIALCTLAFALSSHIWLSVFFLVLIGAFDSISMIIRQTLLQQIPPQSTIRTCSRFKWHLSHFRQSARCPTHEPNDALFFGSASSTYWRDAVFNNLRSKLYSYSTFIQTTSNTTKTYHRHKNRIAC